ncbi:hypothetical protein [Streptomyces sp. NPDC000851]
MASLDLEHRRHVVDALVELAAAHTDMTSHRTVSAGQPLDPTVRTTAGHDTDEDGAERA